MQTPQIVVLLTTELGGETSAYNRTEGGGVLPTPELGGGGSVVKEQVWGVF
jgi:hypothetical protein